MKRIGAVLLSALLLLTTFPTFAVSAEVTETVAVADTPSSDAVIEIVFPQDSDNVSTYSPSNCWYFGGVDEATAYTISFDYYLPKTTNGIRFYSVSQGMSSSAPSMSRYAGIHHFEWTAYSTKDNGQLVTAIDSISGTQMYIWNWKVTIGGEEIVGAANSAWNGQTNGTVGRKINQYYWYAAATGTEMDMSPFAEMKLTQIDFTATDNQWMENVHKKTPQSEEQPYTVSFDYYLIAASGVTVTFSSRAGYVTYLSGSSDRKLVAGMNSFAVTCYVKPEQRPNGTFAPQLISTGNATLYMWNYTVTWNGEVITGSTQDVESTARSATAAISGFSWYTGESVVDAEQPVTENTAILYNEKHSLYDEQGEAMRQQIVNTAQDLAPSETGKTYYVSMSGDNRNDGLSPSTAWRDTNGLAANTAKLNPGDVVLFERGGVYRGTTQMTTGVSYGAYGVGPKPCLYASPRNYADESLWTEVAPNVWRVAVPYLADIGNVVFDHGVVCASDYKIVVEEQMTLENLTSNFQYYHINDSTLDSYLYMYYDGGNPAAQYSDIEFCQKKHVFSMAPYSIGVSDIRIDNLCIKYGGAHGIVFRRAQDITITNCEIGYIGGSEFNDIKSDGTISFSRYGNGIEFNSHATNALVENNWIYQCYDAGYTNQGNGAFHTDIVVRNNLIEYCNYNIELFGAYEKEDGTIVGMMENCIYEKNLLRFAGYGFGTNNRVGSSDIVVSHVCYWYKRIPSTNVHIQHNIFDTSYRFLLVSAYVNDQNELAPYVHDNVWVQQTDKKAAVALQVDTAVDGWLNFSDFMLYSANLAMMRESVAVVDTNPTLVIHESYPPTSIAVATQPTKTVYQLGEELDTTGLTLTLCFSDGSLDTLTDGYTVSGFDSATAGTKTVTVAYRGKRTAFNVTVKAPVTLAGIAVATGPTKTVYQLGEALDTAGLTLTLRYSDGTTKTVSDGYTVSGFDSATAGTKIITITYEGKTTILNVTVKAPVTMTGIAVATQPTKTTYELGEELDTTGLTLTLRYSDGTTKTLTDGYTVSGFDSATAGTKIVTVTYEGKTATFTVKVNAPTVGDTDPAFVVETPSDSVRAGETFTVTLNTKNNPGIVSLMVKVGYDADVLELVSAAGQDFAGTSFGPLTANPIAVNWYDTLNPNNTTDGVVAVLTFRVKEDAAAGDTAITLSYNPNNVYDFDFENVTFATIDGIVTVADYLKGDVNADGVLNNKDLGLLQRYLNGWDVDVDLRAAEVTADGQLNNKDLGMLQRYLNGWDVELK